MPIIEQTEDGIIFDQEQLHNAMPRITESLEKMKSFEEKFLDLCEDDKLNELKDIYYGTSFMTKFRSYMKINKTLLYKLYDRSIINSKLEVYKWLESINIKKNVEKYMIYTAIINNNYPMAKYLYKKNKNIFKKNDSVFNSSIFHNSSKILRLLALQELEKKQNYEFMKWYCEISNMVLVNNNEKWFIKSKTLTEMVLRNEIRNSNMNVIKECPICFEEDKADVRLECGHEFCVDCLDKMYDQTKCSMCRKEVDYKKSTFLIKN